MTPLELQAYYQWMTIAEHPGIEDALDVRLIAKLAETGRAHLVHYLEDCYTRELDYESALMIQARELERFLNE